MRAVLDEARRGVLSTIAVDGSPHSVPVVFVIADEEIVTPIDDKPKDGADLVRVHNIQRDPRATLLVDRWTEDWTRLGWVMVRGVMRIEEPSDFGPQLLQRYEQYTDDMTPGSRALVLTPQRISWWRWS
ncbi:MAG TPA: pyridoxamine 5'-phosphate oxidase family protein [Actinomycetota bacterium]|nr:pyridoxamine 5'-phosphate oxidase family protein [Actinomycetota bacterium]